MKKHIRFRSKILITVSTFIIFATSCINSQPKCTQSSVKETLFQIIRERLEKEYKSQYFSENWKSNDLREYATDNELDVESFLVKKHEEMEIQAQDYARERANKADIELINTRLVEVEENLKKCECITKFKIEGEVSEREFNYTAQITEDDKVYVELLIN